MPAVAQEDPVADPGTDVVQGNATGQSGTICASRCANRVGRNCNRAQEYGKLNDSSSARHRWSSGISVDHNAIH